jgi:DNA-binding XRE family transcriptional regulator
MKPPTIIEFLIGLGGVRDTMGDLRAMDLHRVNKGVFGRLAHNGAGAITIDRAREAAEEARYIRPDSTISDLLEAIRDQASGLPGLVAEERGDGWIERRDAFDPRVMEVEDLDILAGAPDTGPKLRDWRLSIGWTQARAATELGMKRRIIIMYECGDQPIPRVVQLACIALALSVGVRV